MLRTIIWFVFFWISLFSLAPSLIKTRKIEDISKRIQIADEKARWWAFSLLKLAGCEVEVIGEEWIPKDRAVLFVCNHQSNFDIPLCIAYLPKTKGFIAKIELLKMPIVRDWMRQMQCVFMDRSDMRQQVKCITQGIQILKSGQSMVIFPEGTRSKTGEIQEFKPGGLKLATKSSVPIIPVTIKNSVAIMRKGSYLIRPAKVQLIISEPIEIEVGMNQDTVGLTERVKAIIERNL